MGRDGWGLGAGRGVQWWKHPAGLRMGGIEPGSRWGFRMGRDFLGFAGNQGRGRRSLSVPPHTVISDWGRGQGGILVGVGPWGQA